MSNFYQDVISKDPRYHTTKPVNDKMLLEPVTREAVLAIIADAKSLHGIDIDTFETYRSKERQELLFKQKATKLKTVGVHHYGLAADFVKIIAGEPSWKGDFSFLVALCKKHGLISGSTWGQPKVKHTFVDPGHVQRITLQRQPTLFNLTWYPSESYSPYLDGAA